MDDSFDRRLRNTSSRALIREMLTTLTPKDTPGPLRASTHTAQRKLQMSEKEGKGDVSVLLLQSSAPVAVTPLRPTDQTYGFLGGSLESEESSLDESINLQAAARFQAKRRRLKIPDQSEAFQKPPKGGKRDNKSSRLKNTDVKSSTVSSDQTYASVSAMDSSDSSISESINLSATAARFKKKKIQQSDQLRLQEPHLLPQKTSQLQKTEEEAVGDKTYANLILESSTDSIDLEMARRLRYPRKMTVLPEMPENIMAHLKREKDKIGTSKSSAISSKTSEKERLKTSGIDIATQNPTDSYSLLNSLTVDDKSLEEVEHIKERFSHKSQTLNLNLTSVMEGLKPKAVPDISVKNTGNLEAAALGTNNSAVNSPSKHQQVTVVEVHNSPSLLQVTVPQLAGDDDQGDETILPPPSFRDHQQDEEEVSSQGLSTSFTSESSDEDEILKSNISQALTDLDDAKNDNEEELQHKADLVAAPLTVNPRKSESPRLRKSPRKSGMREETGLPSPKGIMATTSEASPRKSLRMEKAMLSNESSRRSLMREVKDTTPSKASPSKSLVMEEKTIPSKASPDKRVSGNLISPLKTQLTKSTTSEGVASSSVQSPVIEGTRSELAMPVRRENVVSLPETTTDIEGKTKWSHTETATSTEMQEKAISQLGESAEEGNIMQRMSEVEDSTHALEVEEHDAEEAKEELGVEEQKGEDSESSEFMDIEDGFPYQALQMNTEGEVTAVAKERDHLSIVGEKSAYGDMTKNTNQSSPEIPEKNESLPSFGQKEQRGHKIDRKENRHPANEEENTNSLPANRRAMPSSHENLMGKDKTVTYEHTAYTTFVEEEELSDSDRHSEGGGALPQQQVTLDKPESPRTSQGTRIPLSETQKVRQMTMKEYLQKLAVKPMPPPVSTKPKVKLVDLFKTGKIVNDKRPGTAAPKVETKISKKKPSLPATLPQNLNREIFTHFAKCHMGSDALRAVVEVSCKYWKNVSEDLVSLATARKGPEEIIAEDVVKLFFRQGLVNSKNELHALVEEYLPHEDWNILLPTTFPKNVVHPKKSDPLSVKNFK